LSVELAADIAALRATAAVCSGLAIGSTLGALTGRTTVGPIDLGRSNSSGSAPDPATMSVTTAIAPLQNRLSIMLCPCAAGLSERESARPSQIRPRQSIISKRRECGTPAPVLRHARDHQVATGRRV
jgi:hypothetical protein